MSAGPYRLVFASAGFAAFMFLLYTDVPVPLGAYYLPSAALVALACVGAPWMLRTLRRRSVAFLLSVLGCAGLSVLLSESSELAPLSRSFLQFAFAMAFYVAAFDWIAQREVSRYLRVGMLAFLAALTVGALCERHAPIVQAASDAFRSSAYRLGELGMGHRVYENEARDDRSYGGRRSSFFAPEPSMVATAGMVAGVVVVVLAPSWWNIVFALIANLLLYYATRSPVGFIGLAGIVGTLYWRRPRRAILAGAVGILALMAALPWIGLERVAERVASMDSAAPELSVYSRIYVPYMVATPVVAMEYPIFGIGFGAKDVAAKIVPTTSGFAGNEFTVGTNGFMRIFIYMGLGLGGVFYLLCFVYGRVAVGSGLFVVFTLFLAGHCIGSIEGARFWGYMALMHVAFRLGDEPETVEETEVEEELWDAGAPS